MRKFNVTVNGKSYVVDVEEVGSDGQVTPVISTVAAARACREARGGRRHAR